MTALPRPEPGLVVRYGYLWHHEAMRGRDAGQKDRPCVIVIATLDDQVAVVPITHAPPPKGLGAVELPPDLRAQPGLEAARSWVVTTDVNRFGWPGPDLRPARGQAWVFGRLPPTTLKAVLRNVRDHARDRTLRQVNRD